MVTSITSFSHSGLRDWLVQRVSAVVMAVYIIFLAGFILMHSNLDYQTWQGLFAHTWMRVITLLFLLSLVFHAWIGLWIVSTDYIKGSKTRLLVQVLIILALIGFFIWGVEILWGL